MSEKYKNLGTKVEHRKTPKGVINKLGENKSNISVEGKTSMSNYNTNNEPQHITILSVSSEIKRLVNSYIRK